MLLTFVDASEDFCHSSAVLFQKDLRPDPRMVSLAWQVFSDCGRGKQQRFLFPDTLQALALDRDGNYLPPLKLETGSVCRVAKGRILPLNVGATKGAITVVAEMELAAVAIGRGERPMIMLLQPEMGETVLFHPDPLVYMTLGRNIRESRPLEEAELFGPISALNIPEHDEANIVLVGGYASPLDFRLELSQA